LTHDRGGAYHDNRARRRTAGGARGHLLGVAPEGRATLPRYIAGLAVILLASLAGTVASQVPLIAVGRGTPVVPITSAGQLAAVLTGEAVLGRLAALEGRGGCALTVAGGTGLVAPGASGASNPTETGRPEGASADAHLCRSDQRSHSSTSTAPTLSTGWSRRRDGTVTQRVLDTLESILIDGRATSHHRMRDRRPDVRERESRSRGGCP
jgi:hypothetical protein